MYSEFIKNSECLPLLRHVIENGNTTVYQYVYKEVPSKIEEPASKIIIEDINPSYEVISKKNCE